jgi:aryl-alcohol dehydrogenase-like predicted oxidoreductase
MRTHQLGRNGPQLSVIGFGANEVGETDEWPDRPSRDVLHGVIRSALDAGINWLDTAEIYGDGNSETLIGETLLGRRDEVFITSKVAPNEKTGRRGTGYRPEEVRAACDASLQRLQTDWIDLYLLHRWPFDGETVPIEETWGTMSELADEGKVRYVGVSNFKQEQIERCMMVRHVDALEPEFAMTMPWKGDLIRWCGEQGIGVISYAPLGYGVFRETIPSQEDLVRLLYAVDGTERRGTPLELATFELLQDVHTIAARLGVPVSHLALAWNVQQPGVTWAIAGSKNPVHIRENAAAGDLVLDDATMNELDALAHRLKTANY